MSTFAIGDTITMTRQQFITLAHKGLVLALPHGYTRFLYDLEASLTLDRAYGLPNEAIQGYIFSSLSGSIWKPQGHLSGFWGYFDRSDPFTVVSLPQIHLYRRPV